MPCFRSKYQSSLGFRFNIRVMLKNQVFNINIDIFDCRVFTALTDYLKVMLWQQKYARLPTRLKSNFSWWDFETAIKSCFLLDTWIHGYMDTWIHRYIDIWIHRYMDTWLHGYVDTPLFILPLSTINYTLSTTAIIHKLLSTIQYTYTIARIHFLVYNPL